MTRFIERLLRLERGDFARGFPLFSYLFLILASYVAARVARDALFLDKFEAVQLPYADIAIAVLVGFVVAGYIRVGRAINLRNLLLGSLFFFATNCLLFWWLAHTFQLPWLYPVIYVWVGIFGVLATAQAWTLANYMLTTREAKRLFGLVGGGAILGAIIGGKFANLVVPKFGTESLFLAMMVALVVCAGLVVLIWRQKRSSVAGSEEPEEAVRPGTPQNLLQSLRLVRQLPYLQAIAALILIASLVTSIAGWQFKAIAKQFVPGLSSLQHLAAKDALAAFFGEFYFYAGVAGLLVQLLLTSRVLRRFGLGPALFVVPVALLFGSVGVLVWGTLWAAIGLRGSINVFQYSIDKSAAELLYLPVPANMKIQVKSFIDTVVWRLGDGLAGVLVLLFATYQGLTASQVSWVSLVLIMGWLTAAFLAGRLYVAELRESIRQHRLDAERASAPVLDRSSAEIFAMNLNASDVQEILYALSLFEVSPNQAAHAAVRNLLRHPAPEVRQKAISILAAAGDKTALPQIETLLRDPHLEVRTEALLYLSQHSHIHPSVWIRQLSDLPDFSVRSGVVAFLARPGETQDLETARLVLDSMIEQSGPEGKRPRLEAARLIGVLPEQFDEQLRLLLTDPDVEVVRQAIATVGKLRTRSFIPRLLHKLTDPDVGDDVAEALVKFGDRIVGTLRDYLGDPTVPIDVRREIPNVLVYIGTAAAERVMLENMLQRDTTLRFRIISSLNKLQQSHPEINLDRQMIETVLAAEILAHYHSHEILGTLGGNLESDNPGVQALRKSMNQEVERIFRLLGLLFPHYDLDSAYFGLQSKDAVVRANALEFLDNILRPQMRNLLVPLLDREVSIGERVQQANRLGGGKVESHEEVVTALLFSEDSWLKSCGAYAIGMLGLKSLERELDNCLSHPDRLLRQAAREAKLRLAAVPEADPS
ncbi:HEAT repeat domain-containing protein [Acidobacteriia bacterium AH_259_A11_L15]|nr:HEAT repeat domain-containing protein [Acidobacteriia bacterium AH_259_A11_L15]